MKGSRKTKEKIEENKNEILRKDETETDFDGKNLASASLKLNAALKPNNQSQKAFQFQSRSESKTMSGEPHQRILAAPFKCSLSKCGVDISSSTLLAHFMKFHQITVRSVEWNEKILLMVALPEDFPELEVNICLGVLALKASNVNHFNVLLPDHCKSQVNELPIVIMACRGNYNKMFDKQCDVPDPEGDFLAIWLNMPITDGKKIHATLTVHNEELTMSLSSLVLIRNVNATQNFLKFMEAERNFLMLHYGFLGELAGNGNIYVEISMNENLM